MIFYLIFLIPEIHFNESLSLYERIFSNFVISFFSLNIVLQLRYQKCLDAHPGRTAMSINTPGKGIGATLKSLVGTLTGRKAKGSES